MKNDRIPCEVPFCRRTGKREPRDRPDVRIICGKHWRLGDARPRRLYSAAQRKFKRTGHPRYERLVVLAWERVRTQAIERAAGVSA